MANLCAKFEERNSNDASTSCSGIINSFGYATTSESYGSIHELGAANDWTFEEQAILDDLLVRYSSESTISRYAKIASQLGNKTIRDVAMRCRWMSKKEIGKRRKEDLKPLRRVKDKKESVDMATKSTSSLFAVSPKFIVQDGMTSELLKQNEDLHKQIYRNLAYLKLEENIEVLSKSRENLKKLMNKLDDDEWMKNMPPLPVMLNEQLADIILPPSYPPKQKH